MDPEGEKTVQILRKGKVVEEWPYEVEEGVVLGQGGYSCVVGGVVKEGHEGRERTVGCSAPREVALKVIDKTTLDKKAALRLQREVEIHTELSEAGVGGVVRLVDTFETPSKVVLVMERMEGGELFDRIVAKKSFAEAEAADLFRTVVECVASLHARGIAHRDLKPENMLFAHPGEDAELKIADFGLAKRSDDSGSLLTPCGTPGYIASEIAMLQPYTLAVDCWALGVILYTMLVGFPPFYSSSTKRLLMKVKRGAFSFPSPYWDPVSEVAKDLVRSLICVDPSARITAAATLVHPWLAPASPISPFSPSSESLLTPRTMRTFSARSARDGNHDVNIALALAIEAQRSDEEDIVQLPAESSLFARRRQKRAAAQAALGASSDDVIGGGEEGVQGDGEEGQEQLQAMDEGDLDQEIETMLQEVTE